MTRREVWVKFATKALDLKKAQGDSFDGFPVDYEWCAQLADAMLRKFDKRFPENTE